MKFHPPSFVLGFGSAVVIMATRHRLRPVVVELSALGLHLARVTRALAERQREHVEDLRAEIEERVRERIQGRRRTKARPETARAPAGEPQPVTH